MQVSGFTVLADINILADNTLVPDSDDWVHFAEVTNDIIVDDFVAFFFLFLFEILVHLGENFFSVVSSFILNELINSCHKFVLQFSSSIAPSAG